MKPKAIVFNCHYNGLSIIQELGKKGISCIAMDCKRSIGTYSKYANYIQCPDPLIQEKQFIDFLYEFCKKQDIKPVLYPTNDHWASAISRYKKLLYEVAIPIVGDLDSVTFCLNKDIFYEKGTERGYLTPNTWSFNELKSINENIYPIIIKPKFRRMSSNNNSKNISKKMDELRFSLIKNKKELDEFVQQNSSLLDHLIFQQFIYGLSDSMYTVGIYADKNSDVLGIFTGHKVRGYPADSGDCIVGESIVLPDYVIENTLRIVREIGYNGIAEFEYKKDASSGQFRLIEINPRSWSWIGITSECEVNLPLLAYYDSCGIKFNQNEFVQNQLHVKYIKLIPDFMNCIFWYRKTYPPWSMNLFEWKRSLQAEKNIYAEFNASDILVSLKSVYDNVLRLVFGSIRRLFPYKF